MLRLVRHLTGATPSRIPRRFASSQDSEADKEKIAAARDWLQKFNAETIPRNIGDVTFSRSSGPGGQNVNKVNSKATLTIPFQKLAGHVPALLIGPLRNSRIYKSNSDAILIQCDDSRKQADNVNGAYRKLTETIVDLARHMVPGETSDAQRKRVSSLKQSENESRMRMKKSHSSKKSARKGKGGSDY